MTEPGAERLFGKLDGLSVHDVIDKRATETPDRLFLIDPTTGRSLTYGELQEAAQAVADRLVCDGAQPGDTVAYAMTNGADAVRAILGLMYGGFVATAVNLIAGKQTISYVLEHCRARFVLCQTHTREQIEETGVVTPIMEVDETFFQGHLDPPADHVPNGEDDGLLMYTSGTTGTPKGVLLTHRNLLAGGCNTAEAHELAEDDRGLCVLPLYHINGLCVTLLGALVSGSCVIMPNRFSVSQFWTYLREHEGTWFSVVPTQISYLLNEAESKGHDRTGLEKLRFGRSASAPLSPDVQQAFESRFGVPVVETMGLTETSAQILSNPMHGTRKIGSPGIATGNQIMIADDNQKEVPIGTEGELLVLGPNVMRGYLRNEEATRAALTPDGWLRTGDLGRTDEDGYVYITGRLKELIIKGGENIAPREIDDALYAHPDVVEAAAFARSCDQYGQRIEAGVMVRSGSLIEAEELIALCREKLGAFKSPDKIHFFPELPKGPSGKIQRLKLAEMALAVAEV